MNYGRAWMLVFPLWLTGCSQGYSLSESPHNRTRIGISQYVLWSVSAPEQAAKTDTSVEKCPLVIQRFGLPALDCESTQAVKFSSDIHLDDIAHWRGNFIRAGASVQMAQSVLGSALPRFDDISPDEWYMVGALDATASYVLGFVWAPEFQSPNCGMGFTRYRLTRRQDGTVISDRDACVQGIHGEFSGFVEDTQNLCYFIERTTAFLSDGELSGGQQLAAIRKTGEFVPLPLGMNARTIAASPDRTRIAILSMTEASHVAIEMYDSGMRNCKWTVKEDFLDPEEMVGIELLWSSDSRILCIALGDYPAPCRLLILESEHGRKIAHTTMVFGSLTLGGAAVLVPKSSDFHPFDYFALEPCD